MKSFRALIPALISALGLSGCTGRDYLLFHPHNLVSGVQYTATLRDVGIMLLIILPVTVLIALFVWRYRKSANAKHDPNWSHSLVLELLVWGVPFVVVGVLGFLSFRTIYAVNPYNPTVLAKRAPDAPVVKVDVVATDWQWVFIYPAQKIATIDELVVPAGSVVKMRMTSSSVSNDIFVPGLTPMMAVMPGMRTRDIFDAGEPGDFTGFAADFSGAGFSWMQFATHVVPPDAFDGWVAKAQASTAALTYPAFQKLAQPTVNYGAKISYFTAPDPQLFEKIVQAARDGVTYPVSDTVTKSVANNE